MAFSSIAAILLSFLFYCAAVQVKINNEVIMDVDTRLDGNDIKNIKVTSLDFIKNSKWSETIRRIENFDDVQRISVDDNSLVLVPSLEDVPELRELSLNQNAITTIYTSHFFFTELTKISLANNLIKSIYNNCFNKELTELNMMCNSIKEVSSSWFTNPENMEILNLSNNKITSIKQTLFRRFSRLKQLNLSGNKIATIEHSSFTFDSMQKLDLSFNAISELNSEIFSHNSIDINTLDISFNKLNYLSELFIKTILNHLMTKQISIFGNPWQCFCLRRIEKLFFKYHVNQVEAEGTNNKAICISSLLHPNTCVEQIDPELYATYSKVVTRKKPSCLQAKSVLTFISSSSL